MPIPDEILDQLAERYQRACIDSDRYPFGRWAAVEAEKMGFRL
ncbi:hypothetical protein J6TS7_23340 [Paenibacillus dendritiformis]|nr:hypothetical protein J6TS7_23340 [Paenibacillus dendritiformis]